MLINRIKWVLGLLLVFFLVLGTNLMDQRNFQLLQSSIEQIYQKQLVSKNILLELSTLVHEKAMANALSDSSYYATRNKEVNTEIDKLFLEFEETELEYMERRTLNSCSERLHQIFVLETEKLKDPQAFLDGNRREDLALELERISSELAHLSLIQLEGGRNQVMIGENAISSIQMFTRLENIFLIIIAVLIQILILYRPRRSKEDE